MDLEFHQLELRYEHLRVRRPDRERRLLASLAATGQQVPIVVVSIEAQADRYLVIDGYKRVWALKRLGRDTVRATVWQMTEAEALLLDRSIRTSGGETALEEGWLLAELEERFGYSLDELARRFDRSTSWISRRLALVELLPGLIQQQVRAGEISAHVAMKFLVPVARANPDDCRRMAEAFATHRFNTREASELYAAWRDASPGMRERILEQPQLFLKARRETEKQQRTASPATELLRDLEVVQAIANRAGRRWPRAAPLMDHAAFEDARHRLERALDDLNRLAWRIKREEEHVEQESADGHPGAARPGSEEAGDCPDTRGLAPDGAPGPALELVPSPRVGTSREGRTLPLGDPRAVCRMQRESRAGP
jgi:ParB/RepB/Spo0J family partition protein